jgi:hypothetical protein
MATDNEMSPEVPKVPKVPKGYYGTTGAKSAPYKGGPIYGTSPGAAECQNTSGTFALTLRALPGWPTPGWQRLRAALKRFRRTYGLACTSCKPAQPESTPEHDHL